MDLAKMRDKCRMGLAKMRDKCRTKLNKMRDTFETKAGYIFKLHGVVGKLQKIRYRQAAKNSL